MGSPSGEACTRQLRWRVQTVSLVSRAAVCAARCVAVLAACTSGLRCSPTSSAIGGARSISSIVLTSCFKTALSARDAKFPDDGGLSYAGVGSGLGLLTCSARAFDETPRRQVTCFTSGENAPPPLPY